MCHSSEIWRLIVTDRQTDRHTHTLDRVGSRDAYASKKCPSLTFSPTSQDSPDGCDIRRFPLVQEEDIALHKSVELVKRQTLRQGDMVLTHRGTPASLTRRVSDFSDLDLPPLEMLYGPHLKFHPEESKSLSIFL